MIELKIKYKIISGIEINRYIGNFCSYYPDEETLDKLERLSTVSLVKGYLYAKNNAYLCTYFKNLKLHFSAILEKREVNLNGVLSRDYEDDSHLELAPDYYSDEDY